MRSPASGLARPLGPPAGFFAWPPFPTPLPLLSDARPAPSSRNSSRSSPRADHTEPDDDRRAPNSALRSLRTHAHPGERQTGSHGRTSSRFAGSAPKEVPKAVKILAAAPTLLEEIEGLVHARPRPRGSPRRLPKGLGTAPGIVRRPRIVPGQDGVSLGHLLEALSVPAHVRMVHFGLAAVSRLHLAPRRVRGHAKQGVQVALALASSPRAQTRSPNVRCARGEARGVSEGGDAPRPHMSHGHCRRRGW